MLPALAIFSRNHPQWLERAASRPASTPTVFRARSRWATAEREIARTGPLPIYFAVVGGDGEIEYAAELWDVLLNPVKGTPETATWLSRTLPETRSEELWDPPARTLYEIRRCRRLSRPFSITQLVKASDGKPISAEYGYSYAVVRARTGVK